MGSHIPEYLQVKNDPVKARIYTLENGLKVYLSVNRDEPRIQSCIAVKAGFKNDPDHATGLAHYLEHMMFKGSDKMGTLNWEKEAPLLKKIGELYEKQRQTNDPGEKEQIYSDIDRLSTQAAFFAVPNEYDKLVSAIGARNTNAYTSFDQTVYLTDIPSHELERWLMIESERFRNLVLRLFHTELETVYEEFNMRNLDSDGVKVFDALFESLFHKHPYGRQPSIGKPEHLKNPSMREVYRFFEQYYVPGNMAICLSGDLDPGNTIRLINKHFGTLSYGKNTVQQFTAETGDQKPQVREVWGNEAERLAIAYRFPGAGSRESGLMKVAGNILYNQRAGLLDIHLNQKQKVLQSVAEFFPLEDYGILLMEAKPREGQVLEEVQELLMKEIDHLKQGKFAPWLVEAVVNDLRFQRKKQFETNQGRADAFVEAFSHSLSWEDVVYETEYLKQVSYDDVVNFARSHFNDNYAIVKKRKGADPHTIRIEKPQLTPLKLNRQGKSKFFKQVLNKSSAGAPSPRFVDFEKDMHRNSLHGNIPFFYVKNETNDLFHLSYVFDMGTNHERKLGIALTYFTYLGTKKYSPAEIHQEFYRLGLRYGTSVDGDQIKVTLEGLEESFEQGVALLEHLFSGVLGNEKILKELKGDILKQREDEKSDKSVILRKAMVNYARYGPHSPFTHRLSKDELDSLQPGELVEWIHNLCRFPHRIYCYGQQTFQNAIQCLEKYHPRFDEFKAYPRKRVFHEKPTQKNRVYFVDFDTVQAEMILLHKGPEFNKAMLPSLEIFNEYFGGGLSSIVYQDIREAKALAYAAFSFFRIPKFAGESFYYLSYLGTQSDKLKDALDALKALMWEFPDYPGQFEYARDAVLKRIETERITKTEIFNTYEKNKRLGIYFDIREMVYKALQKFSLSDLRDFFDQYVHNQPLTYLVLGNKKYLDFNLLESIGQVTTLKREDLFVG